MIQLKNKCDRCGYEWDSRKDSPKSCPKCKRYDWDDKTKNN